MAKVLDFTAALNERAAKAKFEKQEQAKQEYIDTHIQAGRDALAVGDIAVAMEHASEIAKVTTDHAWQPAYCDPRNEFKGSKYHAAKSTSEVPALMRQDIKDAITRGMLPKGIKVSVRKEKCTWSWEIRMTVTALPEGWKVYNPEYLRFTGNLQHPPRYPENWDCAGEQAPLTHIEGGVYTPEVTHCLAVLKDIYNSYQRDNSDHMSDYFDVRYYGDCDIHYSLGEGETA